MNFVYFFITAFPQDTYIIKGSFSIVKTCKKRYIDKTISN